IISASMLMRPTATGGDCLQDRQILLYQLPDLTNPIAVCGSEYWTGDLDQGNKWYHDLPRDQVTVCQIMDIRHYPEQIINRKMRVVMIVAFGENSQRHPQDTAEESYVLDIWRLLKVIEIWIPAFPRRPNSDSNGAFMDKESNPWFRQTEQETPARVPSIPRKGRVETIFPSRNDNVLRGRIAKLFTAPPTGGSSSSLPSSSPSSSSSTAIATTTAATSSGGSRESQEMLDCIAIFGIQDSDTSAAMVIKKVLFLEDKAKSIASWSKKQISRGVSCMTLFPYHSNYERMLVLFNRYGRGLIWDWVNEKQVAQLHMPVDHRPKSFQDRPKDSSDSNASSANTADTADATNANINANANANANASASTASIIANTTVAPAPSNEMTSNTSTAPLPTSVGAPVITPAPAPNLNANPNPNSNPNPNVDPAAAAFAQHPDLYYWGVQVSWAVEVPIPPRKDPTQRCSFRIVILADGAENEWESCCWHVDSTVLGTSERDLEAPPFIPPNERKVRYKPSESPENTLYADSKRYERQTIGHCLPEQLEANKAEEGKPIIFIAYVVWNHFRIALTSQMGLTIFDMEELGTKEPDETRPVDRQWVTYLDDTKNNPLVDIATVGDNLVITRRHSHMVNNKRIVSTVLSHEQSPPTQIQNSKMSSSSSPITQVSQQQQQFSSSSNPITQVVPPAPAPLPSQYYTPGKQQYAYPSKVILDVRGTRFEIERETLIGLPESILIVMFPNGLILRPQPLSSKARATGVGPGYGYGHGHYPSESTYTTDYSDYSDYSYDDYEEEEGEEEEDEYQNGNGREQNRNGNSNGGEAARGDNEEELNDENQFEDDQLNDEDEEDNDDGDEVEEEEPQVIQVDFDPVCLTYILEFYREAQKMSEAQRRQRVQEQQQMMMLQRQRLQQQQQQLMQNQQQQQQQLQQDDNGRDYGYGLGYGRSGNGTTAGYTSEPIPLGSIMPQNPLLTKQAIIVLREELDYFAIPPSNRTSQRRNNESSTTSTTSTTPAAAAGGGGGGGEVTKKDGHLSTEELPQPMRTSNASSSSLSKPKASGLVPSSSTTTTASTATVTMATSSPALPSVSLKNGSSMSSPLSSPPLPPLPPPAMIKTQCGKILLEDRKIFTALQRNINKEKNQAEQHLMDMLCVSGFQRDGEWGYRRLEPKRTTVVSVAMVMLRTTAQPTATTTKLSASASPSSSNSVLTTPSATASTTQLSVGSMAPSMNLQVTAPGSTTTATMLPAAAATAAATASKESTATNEVNILKDTVAMPLTESEDAQTKRSSNSNTANEEPRNGEQSNSNSNSNSNSDDAGNTAGATTSSVSGPSLQEQNQIQMAIAQKLLLFWRKPA
ncbi:hypothetical protein BX616_002579, partial [Lobosporangium transversale]